MKLLENEREVASWNKGVTTLTNARIRGVAGNRSVFLRQLLSVPGQSTPGRELTSIFLEEVSSVQYLYQRRQWLLFVPALIAAGVVSYGVWQHVMEIWAAGLLVAAIGVLIYLLNSRQLIRVHSAGGSIDIPTAGMKHEEIMNAIDLIEENKEERIHFLHILSVNVGDTISKAVVVAKVSCSRCGSENDTDALFCENCGNKLGE